MKLDGTQMLARWSHQLLCESSWSRSRQQALLDQVGLSAEELAAPDARIGHEAACVLWERLCDGKADDFGARFPERSDIRSLGLLGYIAAASQTLGEMFTRVVRYNDLVKQPPTASLVREENQFSILETSPPGVRPWPRPLAESVLSAWLVMGRRLTGTAFNALEVRFQHPPPARVGDVARVFGCDVTYRAAVNELVLSAAVWHLPLRTSDPLLLGYLETLAGKHAPNTGTG